MGAGSLIEVAKNRMKHKWSISFNTDKVNTYLADDTDYNRLISIASGVRIDTPDIFSNGEMPNKFKALQTMLKNIYSALYTRLRRKDKGLILPISKLS